MYWALCLRPCGTYIISGADNKFICKRICQISVLSLVTVSKNLFFSVHGQTELLKICFVVAGFHLPIPDILRKVRIFQALPPQIGSTHLTFSYISSPLERC